jgi:hypothetical protein
MSINDYCPSREDEDIEPQGIVHANSKRWTNDDGGKSHSPADNGVIQIGNDGLEVILVQDFEDLQFERLGRYAKSASIGAPIHSLVADEDELFKGLAYQSLEDLRVAFAVRGASRVLTHQLVRTRAAAFKQQSQRDSWMGKWPEFRMPESIWAQPRLRSMWIRCLRELHACYNAAVLGYDIPYEDARYILPEGTTNFILCEYSLRTFIETYAYRGCVMFQSEMVWVFRAMRQLLVQQHPYLEQVIKISCEPIHKCTFHGAESVEGTCPFPWAKDNNRTHPMRKAEK